MTASDLTTRNIIYLSPENSIADAAEIFETEIFTEIPIVNSYRKLVGVLSKDDLFRLPMNFPNGWQQSIRELQ
jgi:CBS domain-containing protein